MSRRGELTIAVTTGGGSPALAVAIRRFLAGLFGPEWQGRVDELSALRRLWRQSGAEPATIADPTEAWVSRNGWFARNMRSAQPNWRRRCH